MKQMSSKISEIAEQIRGVTYSSGEAIKTCKTGYLPLLRAGNIDEHGLVFNDLIFVPISRVSSRQKLKKNDVLIAASSGSLEVVGKAGRLEVDFDGTFGAFCKVLRPSEEVDPSYFFHFFKTREYRRHISSVASGININNLRNEHLDDLVIPIPPLAEQKRIAAILDQADALRADRRTALTRLDELTQSIFLDMFGDPATNPKGWPVREFSSMLKASLRNGLSPSNEGKIIAKVLTLSAITGDRFDDTAWKESTFLNVPPLEKSVDFDDFLICRGNGNRHLVGRGYFPLNIMENVTFPDTMIAAKINDKIASKGYIQNIWSTSSVRGQIESFARTTNGTFKINQSMIEKIVIPLPPLALQLKFARRVEAVEHLKDRQREHLARLDELFVSLQHRAFRGEL